MKTGVQISSLRPLLLTPEQVTDAFARVAAMGGSVAQLQWIDRAVPASAIARALDDAGLVSVSVQDFYESVRADRAYYLDLNRLTGGEWLCVSRVPDRLKSREGLDAYVRELRALAEEAAALGQKLCFHPVAADYEPLGGVCPVDFLLDSLPEMGCCLDLYHLSRSGADMPAWIRAHAGRICMVHFKDAKDGRLVPAGQGDTDWRGVVPACLEAGVPYAFVEQETWDADPFDCLRQALDWLNGQIARR
ncbi:MAG: sugar phosphate isomerase/epimerase [Clostridia bacterium]|nr:sugar phosphate isomerase/epimerase [Clostridia bacterium]